MNFSIFARGAALASVFALAACGGTSADTDGDGKISQDEVEAAVAACVERRLGLGLGG